MNVHHIDRTLYDLEKTYGVHFLMYQNTSVASNEETGTLVVNRKTIPFKGIILPMDYTRKFFQDVGYLRANSNFTYGGLDDFRATIVIVRKRRLPIDFEPNLGYTINYQKKSYNQVKFEVFVGNAAYVFTLKGIEGASPYNIINVKTTETLETQELQGGV